MITGYSGLFQFGEDGERNIPIAVFTLAITNGTYSYERLYSRDASGPTPDVSRIVWPAGRLTPPPDSPPCGYDGELCITATSEYISHGMYTWHVVSCVFTRSLLQWHPPTWS